MAEYAEVIQNLRKGIYSPIYFLHGEETFFIDNIIDLIEENALDEAQKSFNQYVLYGKDVSFSDILNVARKYPMMGERQVVIVKEAQEIRDWKKEDAQGLFISYLENPLPTTVLVMGHKYKSLDKRSKASKVIEKCAVSVESKRIYDDQLPNWVKAYAEARGAKFSEKAIMILCENIGNNLQRLANETDKLMINVKPGQSIDELAVQKFVGISKDYNVFELQKALSFRNEARAIKIVHYLAANSSSNPIILLISNLFSYFNKLLLLHHNGVRDKREAAQLIGVNPFFVGEYLQAMQNFNLQVVIRNLTYIHEADLQTKGIGYSNMKEEAILKELIYKLLN